MQRVQVVEQKLTDLPVLLVHKEDYARDRAHTQEQIVRPLRLYILSIATT